MLPPPCRPRASSRARSILSNTVIEWVLADLAVLSCGGVSNGIYPTDAASQVHYLCEDSRTTVLFVEDDEQLDKALEVRAGLPGLRCVIDPAGRAERQGRAGNRRLWLCAGNRPCRDERHLSAADAVAGHSGILPRCQGRRRARRAALEEKEDLAVRPGTKSRRYRRCVACTQRRTGSEAWRSPQ